MNRRLLLAHLAENLMNNNSINTLAKTLLNSLLLTGGLSVQFALAETSITEESINNYFNVMEALEKIEEKHSELEKTLKEESIFTNNGEDIAKKISASPARQEIEQTLKYYKFNSVSEYTNYASRLLPAYLASQGNLDEKKSMLKAQKASLSQQAELLKQSGAPQSMVDELSQSITHHEQALIQAENASPKDIAAAKQHRNLINKYIDK